MPDVGAVSSPIRSHGASRWHPEPELIDIRDPGVSRAALERLGHDAWGAALDYLYDEAFRRAMGEPTTAVPLRARLLRRPGGPGAGPGRTDAVA